jgi:hypothetical protein
MEKEPEDKMESGFDRRKFLLGAAAAVPGMALLNGFSIPRAAEPAPDAAMPAATSSCPLDESPLLNLLNPSDVVFSGGKIWVAEARGYRVRSAVIGDAFIPSQDITPGTSSVQYNFPLGLCALPSGEIAVADTWNHRLKLLDAAGNFQSYIGGWQRRGTPQNAIADPIPGYEAALYHAPEGLSAVSHAGKTHLAVADCRNQRVQVLSQNEQGYWDATYIVGGLGQKDENLRLPGGCALWEQNGSLCLAVVDRGHNSSAGGMGRVKVFLPATSGKLAGKVLLYAHDLELGSEIDDPRRVIAMSNAAGALLLVSGIVHKGNSAQGRIGIFDPISGNLVKSIDLINPTIQNPLGMALCPCGLHLAIANNGRYPDRGDPGEDGFIQIVRLSA